MDMKTISNQFDAFAKRYKFDLDEIILERWADSDYYVKQSNYIHKFIQELSLQNHDENIDKQSLRSLYSFTHALHMGYVVLFTDYKKINQNWLTLNHDLICDVVKE